MSIFEQLRRNREIFEALTGQEPPPQRLEPTLPPTVSWREEQPAVTRAPGPLPDYTAPSTLEEVSRRDVEAGPTPPLSRAFSLSRPPQVETPLPDTGLPDGQSPAFPRGDRGPTAYGPGEVLLETLSRQLDTQARLRPQAIGEEETL